jgi:phage repressor protein C with HTH and peptisase S24 domain
MIKDRADSTKFSQVASELIASGHCFRFQAKGLSMLPVIQDGEFLHVMTSS